MNETQTSVREAVWVWERVFIPLIGLLAVAGTVDAILDRSCTFVAFFNKKPRRYSDSLRLEKCQQQWLERLLTAQLVLCLSRMKKVGFMTTRERQTRKAVLLAEVANAVSSFVGEVTMQKVKVSRYVAGKRWVDNSAGGENLMMEDLLLFYGSRNSLNIQNKLNVVALIFFRERTRTGGTAIAAEGLNFVASGHRTIFASIVWQERHFVALYQFSPVSWCLAPCSPFQLTINIWCSQQDNHSIYSIQFFGWGLDWVGNVYVSLWYFSFMVVGRNMQSIQAMKRMRRKNWWGSRCLDVTGRLTMRK